MAVFNPLTETPTAINTLEMNAGHNLLCLAQLFGTLTYQELPGALLERVVDQNIITAADGTTRLITRISLPLNPAYVTSNNAKLWTYILPLGNTAVPAAFKVN